MARGGGGYGGIGGSGIFGMVGTVVKCDANDTSMYCSLAKFVNMLLLLFILLYIAYFVISFGSSFMKPGRKRGGIFNF